MRLTQNNLEIENINTTDEDSFYRIYISCLVIDMAKASLLNRKIFTYCSIDGAKITNLQTNNLDDYFLGCVFYDCQFDNSLNRKASKKDNVIVTEKCA